MKGKYQRKRRKVARLTREAELGGSEEQCNSKQMEAVEEQTTRERGKAWFGGTDKRSRAKTSGDVRVTTGQTKGERESHKGEEGREGMKHAQQCVKAEGSE